MALLVLALATLGVIFAGTFIYTGTATLVQEVILPSVELSKGVISSGFTFLAQPFVYFFNVILNYIILPLVVIFFVISFFIVQYYLLKFYAWLGIKFYQIYLTIREEDLIHLFQHPSVSYQHLKKKLTENTDTNIETN